MLAYARQVHHEHLFEVHLDLFLQAAHVRILHSGYMRASQVVLPVRPPFNIHITSGHRRFRPGYRLVFFGRAVRQLLVFVRPRLVIVVKRRLVRVMENVQQPFGSAARFQFQLAVL